MWLPKGHGAKHSGGNGLVAVAIDRDKGSQCAIKWALENLLTRGQTVMLIHVVHKSSTSSFHVHNHVSDHNASPNKQQNKDLFLTFHCYCTRKDIHCMDVALEGNDIAKTITEYVSYAAIENLVLGAPTRHGFMRKFKPDVPAHVSKSAPDFCSVYVISKGKISSKRGACRSAPFTSPLFHQLQAQNSNSDSHSRNVLSLKDRTPSKSRSSQALLEENVKSPFSRGLNGKLFADFSESDTDISFISSGRPSTERSSVVYDFVDLGRSSRVSTISDHSFGSQRLGNRFSNRNSPHEYSSVSYESGRTSCSSQCLDEVEAEMRRLKLELKQTMELYSSACKEALVAKQKAVDLQRWRLEEERRLEEARLAEEAALSLAESERAKCKSALEAAEASKRIAELETHKRLNFEMQAFRESDQLSGEFDENKIRYRRYSIDEVEKATEFFARHHKIGEGGYGPVYKGYLEYTPVAVKVLRPDAAQGRSQFQQEIEILSRIRHPNMVLLLGACPEYGIIIYEHMANGSLDDRLFHRGDTPTLSWQVRFRIAAEIATGLLFLHQTKPEPLVHRDLKPGNILLDHNYVSKISDVGLARLVPAIAENVTQYRMTSTAGTFCYIDPEYQQTGMLGVKSDVYSLGVMLLQLITAKPPMGLTHFVGKSIENGTFKEMLDPSVPDWPLEETLSFAKLALQCAELRRKDRPDLGKVVLPELNKLRDLAEEHMKPLLASSAISVSQEVMSDPQLQHSGCSKSHSSAFSGTEQQAEPTEETS